MGNKSYIMADCVCDLPNEFCKENEVELVRFYLQVEDKRFMDGYEISVSNVIEHYNENGTKIISNPPSSEEYAAMYRRILDKGFDIVHFTISDKISDSYSKSCIGRELLGNEGKRVHIVDTQSLSSGMSFLILQALQLKREGFTAETIAEKVKALIPCVNVSFVARNADNLAINERVSPFVANLFKIFKLHPIFMVKEGRLTVAGFKFGSHERYVRRYVRSRLKKAGRINRDNVFIVHAGCSKAEVDAVVSDVRNRVDFKNVYINRTSATVACNCGEGAIGVIYVKK